MVGAGAFLSTESMDESGMSEGVGAGMAVLPVLGGLAIFVVSWLYFALMEASARGATLGKMALGIKVTDLNGGRISFGRASGRFFGKILSGAIFYIGYFMAGFTARKQALHDMLAGCLVINA